MKLPSVLFSFYKCLIFSCIFSTVLLACHICYLKTIDRVRLVTCILFSVVEMFFLNDKEEYLEVELGPWGEHLLLLLKGERNTINHSLPLDYVIIDRTEPSADGVPVSNRTYFTLFIFGQEVISYFFCFGVRSLSLLPLKL